MHNHPAAIAILLFIALAFAVPIPAAPPNILLITSEDNGPQLSCYGDPHVQTPNLDRLAAAGVRFTRAFVTTASCSESRAAILTGLYPHQNGQIGLATHHYRLFEDMPNMVSLLHDRGYRTGLVGKLHVNPESAFPFDYRPDVSDCNTHTARDVRRVADLAEKFFRSSDAPFLLMVNYADAHLPFLRQQHGLPPSPLSAADVRPLPWIGLDTPELRAAQADYYNCLLRLDAGIGQLLAALDAAGRADNTLVIYLGDHGPQFPRGKLASYESSLHVPLIMRWPNHIEAGQVRDELVSTIDLLPTVLAAAGIAPPANLPGHSLLALTPGQPAPQHEYLFSEYHAHFPPLYFPQRTIRDERYKLIVNLLTDRPNPVAAAYTENKAPPYPSYVTPQDVASASPKVKRANATWRDAPPIELYDLKADPYEQQNLAADPALAQVKSRLLTALKTWQSKTADPLTDAKKLSQLTAEHDALAKTYVVPATSPWQYPNYLAPPKTTVPP